MEKCLKKCPYETSSLHLLYSNTTPLNEDGVPQEQISELKNGAHLNIRR